MQNTSVSPGSPAGGRDLSAASVVGVGLIGVSLTTLYLFKPAFAVLSAAFIVLAVNEISQALMARSIGVCRVPVLAGSIFMLAFAFVMGVEALLISFSLTCLALLAWRMYQPVSGYVKDASASIMVLAWVSLFGSFSMLLLRSSDGADHVTTWIALTVASDIGGYLAGTLFGTHRMAPEISPKKTWEGFSGSVVGCIAVGILCSCYLLDLVWWQGVSLGATAVVAATFGDLIASVVKRDLGLKDMGSLLPGHGGVMDRLDSLLATAAPVWILLTLFSV
ncbi:phosphatidate cytidylyltransferase [Streptomyces sp. NPDC085927]|uniref:phosphatidate cytidylyltransferase n=1 Tax=Streptomyces sp. NPDC085927 TaxID=3365738 RepID=UPI0037CD451A